MVQIYFIAKLLLFFVFVMMVIIKKTTELPVFPIFMFTFALVSRVVTVMAVRFVMMVARFVTMAPGNVAMAAGEWNTSVVSRQMTMEEKQLNITDMKIALIGYGKMGHMIEEVARSRGHEIVSIIDMDNQEDFDSPEFSSADVAIEFTSPTSAYANYLRAFAHGVKVVSGSTGWMNDHKDDVTALTKDGANTLFWASNFSLGVAIFSAVNRYLAKIMNSFPSYDVSMEEVHHIHKLDAPSGTAITLAGEIVDNIDRKDGWIKGKQTAADGTVSGSDDVAPNQIPIASVRRGEVPGIHSVTYDSDVDRITITHDAHSRYGFALGAVIAAEYTFNHTGLLTMSDLLKF